MTEALIFFCSVSFFAYGASCLLTERMIREFERYGLASYRQLTGALQILAAIGLLVGLHFQWIGVVAAGGLSLQMACGLWVRISIKDSLLQCLPATLYLILCGVLAFRLA